jgi:hypothetical protein
MDPRSIQTDNRVFTVFGGTSCLGPNAASWSAQPHRELKRTMLRPSPGVPAVTRHIAHPFEALPGPFRFQAPAATVSSFLPDGVTELMRDPAAA